MLSNTNVIVVKILRTVMDCEFHVIIVVSIITNVTVYFLMLLLERGEGGHNL